MVKTLKMIFLIIIIIIKILLLNYEMGNPQPSPKRQLSLMDAVHRLNGNRGSLLELLDTFYLQLAILSIGQRP